MPYTIGMNNAAGSNDSAAYRRGLEDGREDYDLCTGFKCTVGGDYARGYKAGYENAKFDWEYEHGRHISVSLSRKLKKEGLL